MAATVVSNTVEYTVPHLRARVRLSGLTATATETIPFPSGAPDCEVDKLELHVVTEPASGEGVLLLTWASDEANSQFTVKFDGAGAGNLTGAVVDLVVHFKDQAAQDGGSFGPTDPAVTV